MFRQLERAFHVGGHSGGAGGEGVLPTLGQTGGMRLSVGLAPLDTWDSAGGPLGRELEQGIVRFYRGGSYRADEVVALGEEVRLSPGRWYLIAEAPGYVTTYSPQLVSRPGPSESGAPLLVPGVPACTVRLAASSSWKGIERLDVVSLSEAAVYPIVPAERPEAEVPAGPFLTYSVDDQGAIRGIGRRESCKPGERHRLFRPPAPAVDRWSLVVHLDVSTAVTSGRTADAPLVRAELVKESDVERVEPTATIRHEDELVLILADLSAAPVRVEVAGSGGAAVQTWTPSLGAISEVEAPIPP